MLECSVPVLSECANRLVAVCVKQCGNEEGALHRKVGGGFRPKGDG